MIFARARRIAGGAAVTAAVAALPVLAGAQENPACYTKADNAGLSFELIQLAPPPRVRQRSYAFYPLNGAATMQLRALAGTAAGVDSYYFQWANRSNATLVNKQGRVLPRKPNIQPSALATRRQRSAFSSVARADACTLAQTASLLGEAARAQSYARASGLSLVSERQQADASALGPADTCVIAAGVLPPKSRGILLDFEVQDGRDGQATLGFLRDWAQLVHSAHRKAMLLIDPFDAPSQRYVGISAANAHDIVAAFDRTTIFLWSRNSQGGLEASYASQKAMIAKGGSFDGSRIVIDFDLAGTSLEDARFVRRAVLQDHLAGVVLWRNGAQQGGSCDTDVNQKIAMIAFGHPFGHELRKP